MSRDFSLFTVAFGDGIVVVSSFVVGDALDDDGDVVDEDEDEDEPDGVDDDVDDGVADDDDVGLGGDDDDEGDGDIADDEDEGDGVDGVVELDDGVVDVDDDVVDDGGVTSVLRWQPEAAASASAAVRTRGIDRTVMRISGNGRPRRAAPNTRRVAGSMPRGIRGADRDARLS